MDLPDLIKCFVRGFFIDMEKSDLIYHYTSVEGLLGILQSQSIWVSSINGMNDHQEGLLHNDLLKAAIDKVHLSAEEIIPFMEKYQYENPITPHLRSIPDIEANPEFIDTLRELIKGSISDLIFTSLGFFSDNLLPHVCCFSKNKDKLSQWRAYGDDGKGVAIAISREGLEASIKKQDGLSLDIRDVLYDKQDKEEYCEQLISQLLDHFIVGDSAKTLASIEASKDYFAAPLLLKHESFYEEEEVRLICNSTAEYSGKFRCVKGSIISYCEHTFPPTIIQGIVLGPKSSLMTDSVDFRRLLGNRYCHLIENEAIERSNTTYR